MLTSKNLLTALVESRFYMYQLDNDWCIWENMPEEGIGAKRMIWRLKKRADAELFLQLYKEMLLKIIKSKLKVTGKAVEINHNKMITKVSLELERRIEEKKRPINHTKDPLVLQPTPPTFDEDSR